MHLEQYKKSPPELGDRPTKSFNPEDLEHLEEETKTEKIVQEHMFKGKGKHKRVQKYKVQWKNQDPSQDRWKTAKDLKNAPYIMEAWIEA